MKKFSIIIPNYNKEQYIKDCLDSVFNQTFKDFEVLFIDDGSSDNSLEVVKDYDVRLFKTDRKGAGGARNLALDNVLGEYVVFLDSDDYLTSDDILEKLSKSLKSEDIIFLNYQKRSPKDNSVIKEIEEDISIKIEKTKTLGCPTKCFKSELISDIRFVENKRYEDINFTLESMCKAKSYSFFEPTFFIYRKVENSNTTSKITVDVMYDITEEIFKMYKLCFKYPKYKNNILNRIKNDNIPERLEKINEIIEAKSE